MVNGAATTLAQRIKAEAERLGFVACGIAPAADDASQTGTSLRGAELDRRRAVSLGDTLAALHGVIGVLLALRAREASGRGQDVDVALFESVFNVMESLLPEYTGAGVVRQPAGSALPGIAPSNAYRCACGGALVVSAGASMRSKRAARSARHSTRLCRWAWRDWSPDTA